MSLIVHSAQVGFFLASSNASSALSIQVLFFRCTDVCVHMKAYQILTLMYVLCICLHKHIPRMLITCAHSL